MTMITKRIALGTAAAIGFVLASAPAWAQATRTWISGVGDDVNPCSRTAPCKTFQGAISKTAAGGEINCLDPGGFGAVTITKSISLICDNTQTGVLVAATNAIIINSSTAVVLISGFDFEGLGQTGSPGTNGINIINAATVQIRNSKIRGFRNGFGIFAQPQLGSLKLFIDNVTVSESGGTGNLTTGGIGFFPATGMSITATIRNSVVFNNTNTGIRIDTVGTTGNSVSLKIDDSQIDNNGNGILVKTPVNTGTARVMINNSSVSLNTGTGIALNGAGAVTRVSNTGITGNATGVSAGNGAVLSSYGNNQLDGNTNDGAFSGTIPPK